MKIAALRHLPKLKNCRYPWLLCMASTCTPVSYVQSNSAQMIWSPRGGAVLALALSDVDATNQSYYGEQKLYYLAADGKKDCAVEMPKVGLIVVIWLQIMSLIFLNARDFLF